MFERFTNRARRVMVLAQEEARQLGHDFIGTEHVLLGLVREGSGVGAKALVSLGIELEQLRDRVVQVVGRGTGSSKKHIPFTKRAKRTLELSLREALSLGHNYIGTEHVLLALIREENGVGSKVLESFGVDLHETRGVVLALLDEGLATAVGQTEVYRGIRRRRVERALKGSVLAGEGTEIHGPACPKCDAPLRETARFETFDVAESDGDGMAQALFLYCSGCGRFLDDVILPGE